MGLALPGIVRLALALLALAASHAPAFAEPAPWQLEIHAGYGVAASGSNTSLITRPSPVTITGIVAIATNVDPPIAGYGGLTVEAVDRSGAGLVAGVELLPHDHLHLAGGGVVMVAPYTLWGASASIGLCGHVVHATALCVDLQLTAFLAGDDLPDGRAITQGQLVLGLVFDAL